MIGFEFTIVVDRPVEEVFTYLTDPTNLPEWQSMVLESRQESPGPMREGTKITDFRKFLGRRFETTVEVTAFEPNKRVDFTAISGPIPFRMNHTFEAADGSTAIKVAAEGDPGGFFKLAEPLVQRQAERQFKNDYSTLKDLLEARGA
jgi:uncharacterized protein YndB with AHSA1/START domain